MSEKVFWADKVVREITKKKHKEYVCEGMWTPSGYFHIGNARPEIFTPYTVYLRLKDTGFKARQNFVTDDFDPVEKIPAGVPVKKCDEGKFIGFPTVFAPSPFEGYKNWGDYFKSQVTDALDEFGLGHINVQSSFDNYKSGRMNAMIKFSLDHSREIVETWNRVAGTEKQSDFLPVTVVCGQCRKIMFTETLAWDGKKVSYKCKECAYEGSVSPLNGNAKLHWRVHWVASWIINDVAFESAGKDHFSKGGSVDVGRTLIQDVFKKNPPYQIPTEFLQIGGAKMAGSVGNVVNLREWLSVASPELFRFMFFSYKPNTVIEFSLSDNSFVLLNERFERAERIYYGKEQAENEVIESKIKNAYAMAAIGKLPKKMPLRLPYSFAVQISQLFPAEKGLEEIIGVLHQTGHVPAKVSADGKKAIAQKIDLARTWVEKYAPAEFRLCFLEKLSDSEKNAMDSNARKLLKPIADGIAKLGSADEVQQAIFDAAKSAGVPPKLVFKAIYLALLGKDSGPRAGLLILALGKEKCVKRLMEAA